ncbi:hypothetical protein GLOIN_2v1874127 [Rhizophagus irregularis DAOM 181602=DAOM 197198]|nr:hypothetical protein GLOIN_2v1874127 [Rhizophagus irregularis DAOM 181602=DAOM 197198]
MAKYEVEDSGIGCGRSVRIFNCDGDLTIYKMIDNIEIAIENEKSKPHNGKPITKIEVSPNEKYLVTYSQEDRSFVGWDVEDTDEGPLKLDKSFKLSDVIKEEIDVKEEIDIKEKIDIIDQICVSDDRRLACIYNNRKILNIVNMSDNNKEIFINPFLYMSCIGINPSNKEHKLHSTFDLNGKFIVYIDNQDQDHDVNDHIFDHMFGHIFRKFDKINLYWKDNKWFKWWWWNELNYAVLENVDFIEISKCGKLYLLSNNYIHEWDLDTKKSITFKNIVSKKNIENKVEKNPKGSKRKTKSTGFENKLEIKDIKISSNKKFVCLRIKDKITIYSIELGIPIASLDINNNDLYNFMEHNILYPLLLPLLDGEIYNLIMENCWKKCLGSLKEKNKLPIKYQTENLPTLPKNIHIATNFAFGILDGDVWKIKLEENISKLNLPSKDCNKCDIVKSWNMYLCSYEKETYDHLNIRLFFSYMDMNMIRALFKDIIPNLSKIKSSDELEKLNTHWKDIWNIIINEKINKNGELIHINHTIDGWILELRLLNNNGIIVLTTIGLLIYTFNESIRSISLTYFYAINYPFHATYPKNNSLGIKLFIKFFEQIDGLSTISESVYQMSSLVKFWILKYNYYKVYSKTDLPLPNYDSFDLNDKWISYVKDNKEILLKYGVELLTFAIKEYNLELIDEVYKKCINYFKQDLGNNSVFLGIITSTMPLLNEYYPDYILKYSLETTMIIDSPFYNINHKEYLDNLHLYSFLQHPKIINSNSWLPKYDTKCHMLYISSELFKIRATPAIIFMNSYINFVNYPKEYNWILELINPQPSPFVETINRDIYKTWNGESLINFKWDNYGKYYYAIIWIGFNVFLGCFTAAASVPQINSNDQSHLLIASFILGLIHLSFEVRQFIYSPSKWIDDYWNFFDLGAYLVPTLTSICLLCRVNVKTFWLSFSCLLLDLKFLLFFRAFESFVISFAHAFLIILRPKLEYSLDQPTINDDPNNPWNLNTTYNRVENETITQGASFVQVPDENTNMFTDYKTALFAVYLFLTGDTSALTNKWEYKENPALVIYILLFSFLIVIYLMNLFIGLLNMAIEKENNRVSYLVQKAEILADIEMFYMLPHTRRREDWFPTNAIYYYADIVKTRKMIKELISEGEWEAGEFQDMKKDLLKLLNIQHEPND